MASLNIKCVKFMYNCHLCYFFRVNLTESVKETLNNNSHLCTNTVGTETIEYKSISIPGLIIMMLLHPIKKFSYSISQIIFVKKKLPI